MGMTTKNTNAAKTNDYSRICALLDSGKVKSPAKVAFLKRKVAEMELAEWGK